MSNGFDRKAAAEAVARVGVMAPEPTPLEAARKLIEPIIKAQVYEATYEDLNPEELRQSRIKAHRLIGQVAVRFLSPDEAAKLLLDADREISRRVRHARRQRRRRNLHALRPRARMTVARPASRQARRSRERRASRARRGGDSGDDDSSGGSEPPALSRRPIHHHARPNAASINGPRAARLCGRRRRRP
jgi:hypothetical protein